MKYNPDKHYKRSLRLKGYDYSSPGAYFITICAHQRQCLFGAVMNGEMQLSEYGQIASNEWLRSQDIRQEINFDAWVIMPNHIHAIVLIQTSDLPQHPVGAPLPSGAPLRHGIAYRRPRSLSSFVAGFKSTTTQQINIMRNAPGTPVWQRNYYEHIVRNEASLECLRQYIHNNSLSWQEDQLHPEVQSRW
ncbi:MAG TPA: transposase [Coleofasciculaceae cyanobacterium]